MADNVTIIGAETLVSGEIRGDQNILVRGRIDGRVSITSTLTVEDGAILQADVDAEAVLISGVVVGNVSASGHVRLSSKARVVGDVTAPRVIVESGAAYRGRLEMGEVGTTAASRSASRRASESEGAEVPGRALPRVQSPSRAVSVSGSPAVRPATPPRVATANRPAPPSLPRVSAAGGDAARPAWSKKKLHRRR